MVDQEILAAEQVLTDAPGISLPGNFRIHAVDQKLEENGVPDGFHVQAVSKAAQPVAPLGVLSNFKGTFVGLGFNTIFRPKANSFPASTFPNKVDPGNLPDDNVLELNLTQETLAFSASLGDVPNRGLAAQDDVVLNGVPYVQTIVDVSNAKTGKADNAPTAIHFEPGLWMHVPATNAVPKFGASLSRMASIPHGTTINAQCLEPTSSTAGPPTIPKVDITPFAISPPNTKFRFNSQTATTNNSSRLPQDLSKFIAAGTITQAILDDPNTVLRNANKGKNITKTITFTVSTNPAAQQLGGGVANINFLEGASGNPNADATQMTATFWIETVQHKVQLPPWKVGQPPMNLAAIDTPPNAKAPIFQITPDKDVPASKTVTVSSTQIQYSQMVFLNFGGLTWPHASVATLIPQGFVKVNLKI